FCRNIDMSERMTSDDLKTAGKSSVFVQPVLLCLLLVVVTLAVYWPVTHCDFLYLDDPDYFMANPHVQTGLKSSNLVWAFTTGHASNWHPLTWMSHMLDCQVFALWAGGHHLVSVGFHIANALLLFLLLRRMTGALWRSAVVAALFALHPLHVESVAWASERKDVLSTLFFLLTMWAYIWYVESPGFRRYLLILVCFSLGLMAKPMLVTLPFALLLLDYWPLGRWPQKSPGSAKNSRAQKPDSGVPLGRLIWEKAPL